MKTEGLFYKGEAKSCKNCFFYNRRWLLGDNCNRYPQWALTSALAECQYGGWEPNAKLYFKDGSKTHKRDSGVLLGYVPRKPPRPSEVNPPMSEV